MDGSFNELSLISGRGTGGSGGGGEGVVCTLVDDSNLKQTRAVVEVVLF